jgi:perosamine synthetase
VRYLKDHAMSKERRYFHAEVGYNYRMTNIQAALGVAQLERAGEILERKARVLDWYREALAGAEIQLNPAKAPSAPICWLVTALLSTSDGAGRRERVQKELLQAGIDSRPFFVPLSTLPPYAEYRLVRGPRHVAVDLYDRGICLPSSTKLSREAVDRIVGVLQKSFSHAEL